MDIEAIKRAESLADKSLEHIALDSCGAWHLVKWNVDVEPGSNPYWDHGGDYSRSMIYTCFVPLTALKGIAEGTHVIVPVEPTPAIIEVGIVAAWEDTDATVIGSGPLAAAYRAMLKAGEV